MEVEGEGERTIFLVEAVEIDVSVFEDRVVDGVPVCETPDEWAWVFGERVEFEAVYYE